MSDLKHHQQEMMMLVLHARNMNFVLAAVAPTTEMVMDDECKLCLLLSHPFSVLEK